MAWGIKLLVLQFNLISTDLILRFYKTMWTHANLEYLRNVKRGKSFLNKSWLICPHILNIQRLVDNYWWCDTFSFHWAGLCLIIYLNAWKSFLILQFTFWFQCWTSLDNSATRVHANTYQTFSFPHDNNYLDLKVMCEYLR